MAPSHIGKPVESWKTPSLPLSKVAITLSSAITGLLLPLTVSNGSCDLYDQRISPLFLSREINSPALVLTITADASIAALERTLALTLIDHSSEPSFWFKAITLPSSSETITTPNPEAIPEESSLYSLDHISLPDIASNAFTDPILFAKNNFSWEKLGKKLPKLFSPLDFLTQISLRKIDFWISESGFGSSVSTSALSQNFNEEHEVINKIAIMLR